MGFPYHLMKTLPPCLQTSFVWTVATRGITDIQEFMSLYLELLFWMSRSEEFYQVLFQFTRDVLRGLPCPKFTSRNFYKVKRLAEVMIQMNASQYRSKLQSILLGCDFQPLSELRRGHDD